jgi:lycopene cyclase domain-containing protein
VNYTFLALVGVALAVLVDLVLLGTNLLRHKVFWTAYGIVLFFQLATNGVLTGLPVVRYDSDRILGLRIACAPIEDLLFGFAMVTITLSVWVRLGAPSRRGQRQQSPPGPAAGG